MAQLPRRDGETQAPPDLLTMTPVRPNFLPDKRLLPLRSALDEHLGKIAASITPEIFPGLCDAMILKIMNDAFSAVSAQEGSIWIIDQARQNLVVSYNSGARADEIVGFKQPLSASIVSMVVANEHGFVENEVFKNSVHSPKLDERLKTVTYAMIAAPFYYLNACRGVISCVQLIDAAMRDTVLTKSSQKPRGFGIKDLAVIQSAASIMKNLIDYKLLKITVGWNQQ